MDDFADFNTCGVQPLPSQCEILDFDRDNQIGNTDPYLFMTSCFTGPLAASGGESAMGGGSGSWQESAEAEVGDPLDAMVTWCMATLSASERAELAAVTRGTAEGVDMVEAARMHRFADAIDPVE
jgi:hypothetical protein